MLYIVLGLIFLAALVIAGVLAEENKEMNAKNLQLEMDKQDIEVKLKRTEDKANLYFYKLVEIEKEFENQQIDSVENLQNKIKAILARQQIS